MKRLLALGICAVLIVFIWVATVWNNFPVHNGLIADDYLLPVSVLALMAVVLGVNPLLRRFCPRCSFSRNQLAVMCGIFFMAALPPSAGVLRQLAWPLGRAVQRANTEPEMAEAYAKLNPRRCLFPDSLEYGVDLPVVQPFVDELRDGESIPWGGWVIPMMSWSGLIAPWYLMMMAMSVIFCRYWQKHERVPFPLMTVFRELTDAPDEGSSIPPVFRTRGFWLGCGIVFVLHAMGQGNMYLPDTVPAIPLRWNLSICFSEMPWNHLGWWCKNGHIYFTFLGLAFFLQNRISFSIWFTQIVYAFVMMIAIAYFPPFNWSAFGEHRTGSFLVYALFILWLARSHLAAVVRCMCRRSESPEDRAYAVAGWAFVAGCVAMFGWFVWARIPSAYALVFVFAAVLATVTLMRVVAETGLPLFFLGTYSFRDALRMLPMSMRSLPATYFGGIFSVWLGSGQRVCVGAVATQALGLAKDIGVRRQVRLGVLFLIVLLLSVVGGWLFILKAGYSHTQAIDGVGLAWWGSGQFRPAEDALLETIRGTSPIDVMERIPHLLTGGALALVLYVLCQCFSWWPLHPIGLLGAGSWCVGVIWPNIFLGWLLKNLVIRYGGATAYRKARALFIGVIMGEVFAVLFWSALAVFLALTGHEYHSVNILPY